MTQTIQLFSLTEDEEAPLTTIADRDRSIMFQPYQSSLSVPIDNQPIISWRQVRVFMASLTRRFWSLPTSSRVAISTSLCLIIGMIACLRPSRNSVVEQCETVIIDKEQSTPLDTPCYGENVQFA